jgi:hypothetical protein
MPKKTQTNKKKNRRGRGVKLKFEVHLKAFRTQNIIRNKGNFYSVL